MSAVEVEAFKMNATKSYALMNLFKCNLSMEIIALNEHI
jgi:hypothetical protein